MKKGIAILLAAVMLSALGLSGCSKDSAGPSGGSGQQSGDAPQVKDVTITLMDIVPSPQREAFFTSMSDAFKKEQPHITVEYESTPYEESQNKLTTLGAAGDLPDIVNMHHNYKLQFAPSGWLVDLSERIERDGIAQTLNPIITDFQWEADKKTLGGIFVMPDGIMTNGCFIRKDWVEEAGIDVEQLRKEWTWDRYFQLQAELTDPEKNRYGCSYRGADMAGWNIMEMYLCSFSDGYSYDKDGQFILNTPENAQRLQKLIDVYQKGYAPKDSIGWGFAETVDNFTGGLTGTLLNDIEVVATCRDRMKDDEWMVFTYPRSTVDDGIYSYVSAVYDYGISSFSDYPDEAWEFLKFITRPENNMQYCKTLTMLPVVKDTGSDPFFGPDGPVLGFMDQINYDKFYYYAGALPVDVNPASQTVVAEHQKLLQGKITTADFLSTAEKQFESLTTKFLSENEGLSLMEVRQIQ